MSDTKMPPLPEPAGIIGGVTVGYPAVHYQVPGFTEKQMRAYAEQETAALRSRLIWLANNLFERKWNGVIDSGSRFDWTLRGDWRHTVAKMEGETFDAAIDAAMAAKRSASNP